MLLLIPDAVAAADAAAVVVEATAAAIDDTVLVDRPEVISIAGSYLLLFLHYFLVKN